MKRWQAVLLIGVLLLAVGCSKPPERSEKVDQPAPASDIITLKVGTFGQNAMLDVLISAFQETHPQYRIEKVQVGTGNLESQKAMSEKAQKGEIDLAAADWMVQRDRALEPLDPYVTRGFDIKPVGSLVEQLREQGQLYALPYGGSASMLYYNKELLRAAGVEVPTDGFTWDQFREAAARLSKKDQVWGATGGTYYAMARAYAEELTGAPLWKSDPEQVSQALRFFAEMVFTDRSMPKDTLQPWRQNGQSIVVGGSLFQEVVDGRSALTVDSYVVPSQVLGTHPGVGVLPMPTHPGKRPVSSINPALIGIAKGTGQPEAAWEFLRFAAGQEGAVALIKAGYQPLYITDAVRQAAPGWLLGNSDFTMALPRSEAESRVVWDFMEAVNRTLSGDRSWEDAYMMYKAKRN